MNYHDHTPIQLGDKVKEGNSLGVVVAIIEDGLYSEAYPKSDWQYLNTGCLVLFDDYGLVHYSESDEELFLVSRA